MREVGSSSRKAQPEQAVLAFPAVAESVTRARYEVRSFVEGLGARSDEIELAVSEAMSNAVQHGFRGREPGAIEVRLNLLVPDTLLVSVIDDGSGMSPDPGSDGLGYGLALIGRLSDGFEINSVGRGTEVKMRFALKPAPAAPAP